MQEVICINGREPFLSGSCARILVGDKYFLDELSIFSDPEGDWYGSIYVDVNKAQHVGYFKLSHFKTCI